MTISPQSQAVYQALLSSGNPMTAKQLATKLDIYPAMFYRLTQPLEEMGLISKTSKYPTQYSAKPLNEGLSLFLLAQSDWFSQSFKDTDVKKNGNIPDSKEVRLSFIQSRDELMRYSAEEISRTSKSVDLLRSGHELSADVMSEILNAKRRGIPTRMLIQDYSEENAEQVANWQKNGTEVRKTPFRHVRLMVFDSSTVYFMSYKNTDSAKDFGMKIDYPPLAVIFSQLFEQWWKEAEVV